MLQSPPRKIPFSERREREFLYLPEVDALIAALSQTRYPIRNQALALLLFCQALQPVELSWLRWCDISFTEKSLCVTRNRSLTTRYQAQQIVVNLQPLCSPEIDLLQQLYHERTTDWVFASERKQRLSDRSLHHIIQNAGALAELPVPVHPYMLRRSGLYYRAAILIASVGLSLRQCCLLWNWQATNIPLLTQVQQKYFSITTAQENTFWEALEQIRAFTGITTHENVIDYLLGAFSLSPQFQDIPDDYWLAPVNWKPQTLPKKLQIMKFKHRSANSARVLHIKSAERSQPPPGLASLPGSVGEQSEICAPISPELRGLEPLHCSNL